MRWLGLFLTTTVLLDLGLAVTVLYTASDQLVPALHSYWLYIHVSTAIFCGAVLYVGAISTCCTCSRTPTRTSSRAAASRAPSRAPSWSGCPPRRPWTSSPTGSTPPSSRCGRSRSSRAPSGPSRRGAATGAGTKETWAFITWVAYACYLHARSTAGWKGRKAAYIALIAFGCWLFNYYGVNIFVGGKHSYAGV